MAAIVNHKEKRHLYLGSSEPSYSIQSEGDIFIKQLADKQFHVNISLNDVLEGEKGFEHAHEYLPVTEFSVGTTKLEEFVLHSQAAESLSVSQSQDAEESKDNEHRAISRHMLELAQAVKPNSLETKLWQFALSCKKGQHVEDRRPPEHPINKLSEIETELFDELKRPLPEVAAKTVARKRRQLLEKLSEPIGPKPKINKVVDRPTLWDVMELEAVNHAKNPESNNRVFKCELKPKSKTLYTVKNGKIVQVTEKENSNIQKPRNNLDEPRNDFGESRNNLDEFKNNLDESNESRTSNGRRLSIEEIKAIPRFAKYDKGTPSQVLYIKNLPATLKDEEFIALFERYSTHGGVISYKLMKTGKLRGQAFVTFSCVQDAQEALESVNGLIFKNKPIIIEFGKTSVSRKD